jgi:hypothetical protein
MPKKDRDPNGLSQACTDPADLAAVVHGIVEADPTARNQSHLAAVMRHYGGKVNPKAAVEAVNRAYKGLLPHQLNGHARECKMNACELVGSCRAKPRERIDLAIDGLIMTKQIATLLGALQRIQREWSPGRKVSRCDPFTEATKALKQYDEYEELKPNAT